MLGYKINVPKSIGFLYSKDALGNVNQTIFYPQWVKKKIEKHHKMLRNTFSKKDRNSMKKNENLIDGNQWKDIIFFLDGKI